tara:strand:- start:4987 stop:5262 length:276 start_codon:yes stop_codon:yes gene_type:complete
MKAENFLNRLGLSVNIVIVILLLVIVYYVCCINDNLSIERFNIGSQIERRKRIIRSDQIEGEILDELPNRVDISVSPQIAGTIQGLRSIIC